MLHFEARHAADEVRSPFRLLTDNTPHRSEPDELVMLKPMLDAARGLRTFTALAPYTPIQADNVPALPPVNVVAENMNLTDIGRSRNTNL